MTISEQIALAAIFYFGQVFFTTDGVSKSFSAK